MIKITESGSDYIKIEKNKFLKIRLTKTPDPDFANTYTYTAEVKKQYSTPILNQSDNLKNFDSDLQYFKEIGNRLYIESWIALSEDYFKFTYSLNPFTYTFEGLLCVDKDHNRDKNIHNYDTIYSMVLDLYDDDKINNEEKTNCLNELYHKHNEMLKDINQIHVNEIYLTLINALERIQ